MALKQNGVHLQARVSRKTWEMIHDIYSNVHVTWRIPVTLKSVPYDGRWQIFLKSLSKVLEKTINKELNNHCLKKSDVLDYMVYNLIGRLGFNHSSSLSKNLYSSSWNFSRPSVEICDRLLRNNCPSWSAKHVLINFIFKNNLSTHAMFKGNINDNFNKDWRL